MNFTLIQIAVLSYLIGAIPNAWWLNKLIGGYDLRDKGTGNLGAMNSYEVSGKKWIGIAVFFLDALKGVLAILLAAEFFEYNFFGVSLAFCFAVLGHNFNIFMKLKGGRGLATALGGIILINPLAAVLWALMWLTGYFIIKKDVHVGNIFGTFGMIILVFTASEFALWELRTFYMGTPGEYQILVLVIGILILMRHTTQAKNLAKQFFSKPES